MSSETREALLSAIAKARMSADLTVTRLALLVLPTICSLATIRKWLGTMD
jgi:hypothetical protein